MTPRQGRLALVGAVVVVVAGVVAIVAVQNTGASKAGVGVSPTRTTNPVGPFAYDPNNLPQKDTHWHAALGVYDCDHWLGDNSRGSGTWNWPTATPEGAPARAADPSVYAGLHSHDDGLIHMEPTSSEDAGSNATLGRYFDYGGWKLSSTGFEFLGTTRSTGDACGGTPGTVQWEVGRWDGGTGRQTYTVHTGDPSQYKLYNFDLVVIAFLPRGTSIASIGDAPLLANLVGEMGVQQVPASSVPPATSP